MRSQFVSNIIELIIIEYYRTKDLHALCCGGIRTKTANVYADCHVITAWK